MKRTYDAVVLNKNKQVYFVLLSEFALSLRLINKPFDIVTK